MSLFSKLKKRFSPPEMAVRCSDQGLEILKDETVQSRVSWTDVREIFAYKDDLFTYDDICVGFRVADDGTYYWVSEDFIGYEAMLKELKIHYPGFREDWFGTAAFPAFAYNRTTIWGEPTKYEK